MSNNKYLCAPTPKGLLWACDLETVKHKEKDDMASIESSGLTKRTAAVQNINRWVGACTIGFTPDPLFQVSIYLTGPGPEPRLEAFYRRWIDTAMVALTELSIFDIAPYEIMAQAIVHDGSAQLVILFPQAALKETEHDEILMKCRAYKKAAGEDSFKELEL